MHRKMGTPLEERNLEFLHKQPLAPNVGQRTVEHPVAFGGHAENLDSACWVEFQQTIAYMFSLPHCQRAFPGGNHQPRRSVWLRGTRGHHVIPSGF